MIRQATRADASALGEIFFAAIRKGPSPYTEAQRAAWAPTRPAAEGWASKLAAQQVAVAEQAGEAVGFMTLAAEGYIDLAFILPQARGQGLFGELLGCVEDWARGQGVSPLWTHASLMAEPAFARRGFRVMEREKVPCGDQLLARARMEKMLT